MKTVLLSLILFSYLIPFAQSKQETIDWLNSKFSKNMVVYGDFYKSAQRMKINNDGTFEITNYRYEVPLKAPFPDVESTTVLKGSFNNLSPSSVSIIKDGKLVFFRINCGNNNCITVTQSGTSHYIDKGGVTFGAFDANETNIAERLKKAFIHLITLCGGKQEAF